MKTNYKYIAPRVRFVQVETQGWIATSQAGTDPNAHLWDYDGYDETATTYFEGAFHTPGTGN